LENLRELVLKQNMFREPPISVLSRVTALKCVDLSYQAPGQDAPAVFKVPSSLLPILHPGLVKLDLYQGFYHPEKWDALSLLHLRRAIKEVSSRRPRPELWFEDMD
jgi:hypothetical protein